MGLPRGGGWKPCETDNDEGARTGKPVPIGGWLNPGDETLEVPVGWNKPASRRWLDPSGG